MTTDGKEVLIFKELNMRIVTFKMRKKYTNLYMTCQFWVGNDVDVL